MVFNSICIMTKRVVQHSAQIWSLGFHLVFKSSYQRASHLNLVMKCSILVSHKTKTKNSWSQTISLLWHMISEYVNIFLFWREMKYTFCWQIFNRQIINKLATILTLLFNLICHYGNDTLIILFNISPSNFIGLKLLLNQESCFLLPTVYLTQQHSHTVVGTVMVTFHQQMWWWRLMVLTWNPSNEVLIARSIPCRVQFWQTHNNKVWF